MMLGLVGSTGGFLLAGALARGHAGPARRGWSRSARCVFAIAIAIDTIGHRTIYKEVLRGGEQLVHHITIVCGRRELRAARASRTTTRALAIPAMVFTVLSFVYSLVDEVFHWRRYTSLTSDPVEMWSHVGILVGHGTMMLGWWRFYQLGYPGVRETLAGLGS